MDVMELDHAGFVARFGADRASRRWGVAFVALPIVWTVLVIGGFSEGALGWDLRSACMLSFVPFLWGLAVLGVDQAVLHQELRLAGSELDVSARRGPFVRRTRLPLRGLEVSVYEHHTGKGGHVLMLDLSSAGRHARLDAASWPSRARVDELADLLTRLAEAAAAQPDARPLPPEALTRLLAGR